MPEVITKYGKGLALTLLITWVALQIGSAAPLLGSAAAAIALGILVRAVIGSRPSIAPGASFAAKRLLRVAVILLGASLRLDQLWSMGIGTFAIIVGVVALSLIIITWFGRRMQLSAHLSTLIAVGTAICGASAIAAASPIIQADEDETTYAVSTIFAFNVVALFTFPALGHLFGLSDTIFGVWAGTAIHDTSSVVAAAYTYSHDAGTFATVVKLARTTLIIPVLLILSALWGLSRAATQGAGKGGAAWRKAFPWFILGFVGLAGLRTVGLLPEEAAESLTAAAKLLIVVALAGVGLGADLRKIRSTGLKPLFLGLFASVFVAAVSLALALRYVA